MPVLEPCRRRSCWRFKRISSTTKAMGLASLRCLIAHRSSKDLPELLRRTLGKLWKSLLISEWCTSKEEAASSSPLSLSTSPGMYSEIQLKQERTSWYLANGLIMQRRKPVISLMSTRLILLKEQAWMIFRKWLTQYSIWTHGTSTREPSTSISARMNQSMELNWTRSTWEQW